MYGMKYILALAGLAILGLAIFVLMRVNPEPVAVTPTPPPSNSIPRIEVIAEGLEIPWDIAFLPGGDLLVSERPGRVVRVGKDGTKMPVEYESDVRHRGEGGLLGLELHPDFDRNGFIYLYVSSPDARGQTKNRVRRYTLSGDALVDPKLILDGIPGAMYHDGGRMEFGPDGFLYVTTGDATKGPIAQDINSLGGKILRVKDDGTPAPENPFGTYLYSYGHRNPQGLAWDSDGNLWETEHGPTGEEGVCCRDEVNRIEAGKNYGWPTIVGDQTRNGMLAPALQSGSDTWAPASAAIVGDKLFFGGLRGEALYSATISDGSITDLVENFKGEFGRIRTVRVGPDGMLYLTTSNRDDRGEPKTGDDKIIRIDPKQL